MIHEKITNLKERTAELMKMAMDLEAGVNIDVVDLVSIITDLHMEQLNLIIENEELKNYVRREGVIEIPNIKRA